MAILNDIWNKLTGKEPNPLDAFIMRVLANSALYPDGSEETYLNAYTGNNDIFTIINKITEPASTVPIFQYDVKGEVIENGQMLSRLNNPNPYQSRAQFIEAAMTYYLLFGNTFTAYETVGGGLDSGKPLRLDQLPPQFIQIDLGTVFDPVKGYRFYPYAGIEKPYTKDQIFHWKEFNPDYNWGVSSGGHLRGMSRLRPLISR
jgi:phage portal protein BeeE